MNYIASISEDDKGNQRRASTISRKISSIRSFYRYLNEYVGVLNNPLEYIKGPKAPKRIPEFMFIEEIRTFLDSIDDSTLVGKRDRAMFELMYACGLRVSEVTTLQIEDLDFDDHILHVRGKGDKERIVPFYEKIAPVSYTHLDVYKRQLFFCLYPICQFCVIMIKIL